MKRVWSLRVFVLSSLLLLSGCATSPPSDFYTLSATIAADSDAVAGTSAETGVTPAPGAPLSLGLGPVTFPLFLDRPQIVRRDSAHRLRIDDFQRWGGTLQDDFVRIWSENLSALLGTSNVFPFPSEVRHALDFRVAADVLAFEGTSDGDALLKVRWTLIDHLQQRVLNVKVSHYRRPLAMPTDEAALIAAMSAVLGDFSRDVAVLVTRTPLPKRPPQDIWR